ncbi:MAG: efflux RND transporter periplasmic adaptor subunit [Alphaproteobacteria bacterium]
MAFGLVVVALLLALVGFGLRRGFHRGIISLAGMALSAWGAILISGFLSGDPAGGTVALGFQALAPRAAPQIPQDLKPAEEGPTVPGIEPLQGANPTLIYWQEIPDRTARLSRTFSATVQAGAITPLAFERLGTISQINVQVGQQVNQGDMIAVLDQTTAILAVNERQASLVETEALLVEAQAYFKRKKTLHDKGVEAKASLDSAQASLTSATSRVDLARQALAIAEEQLSQTELVAPFSGFVADVSVENFQTVAASQSIVTLENRDIAPELEVAVPEDVFRHLDIGQEHAVQFGSWAKQIGMITEMGSRNAGESTFPVTLAVPAHAAGLKPGMTARVAFSFQPEANDLVDVPLTSIVSGTGDRTHLFVYSPDTGLVEKVEVALVGLKADTVSVSGAPDTGAIIATRGVNLLRDGQRVELIGTGIARFDL